MLVVSLAAGLVPFDPGRVIALRRVADATFKRPVRFGDTLRVEGRIADLAPASDDAGLVTFAWNVVNQDGRTVSRARVEVLWKRDGAAEADVEAPTQRRLRPDPALMGILDGKKLLITGVVNRESIAYEVAKQAQEAGAEVVLTSFGRVRRMTERSASKLDGPPDVLELDVNNPEDIEAVAGELARALGPRRRHPARDRLRARGRARRQLPQHAGRERRDGVQDQRVLAQGAGGRARRPLPRGGRERRGARLRRVGRLAGLRLDGRRQGCARGDVALPGARPRAEGRAREPRERRAARDARRARHPGLRRPRHRLAAAGAARLGHRRPGARRAGAILFLLSDLARGVTGEILHVDGGFHAMGTAVVS